MLRGLAIRQAFILTEWVLVLLVVFGACFVALRTFGLVGSDARTLLAEAAPALADSVGSLAVAKSRAEYDPIVKSGLFGTSGETAQAASAPPAPAEEKETELRLKLCGTTATSPRDPYASAVILNEENNGVSTVGVGQSVVENVTLEEVYPRKVILFNKPANRREVLKSEEAKEAGGQAAAAAPSPPGGPSAGTPNRVTLNKQELVQDLFMNYTDIVSQIKPEMYRDANGNVAGITASNLETIPIAKKLGVKDGDVLQTVNNEVIDSEEKILELVNKYRNSNTFRIGILRDGKPQVITYRLD